MPREAAGAGYIHAQEHTAITLPAGAGQANAILSLPQPRRVQVYSCKVVTAVAGTGAGATRTINVRRGSATGTVIATGTLTLANQGTVGAVLDIPVTGGSAEILDGDTLTVEFPTAGAVAFTAGQIDLVLGVRQRLQGRN